MDLSDIIPEVEETRSAKLFVDIFYRFLIGLSYRLQSTNALPELNLSVLSSPSHSSMSQNNLNKIPSPTSLSGRVERERERENFSSDALQAVYLSQQQQLRHHQQQQIGRAHV